MAISPGHQPIPTAERPMADPPCLPAGQAPAIGGRGPAWRQRDSLMEWRRWGRPGQRIMELAMPGVGHTAC